MTQVRPILEYGDVLYDDCGVTNEIKLNKVHYAAAKIVSGAIHGTSFEALLNDLAWESLKARRKRRKPCLFISY